MNNRAFLSRTAASSSCTRLVSGWTIILPVDILDPGLNGLFLLGGVPARRSCSQSGASAASWGASCGPASVALAGTSASPYRRSRCCSLELRNARNVQHWPLVPCGTLSQALSPPPRGPVCWWELESFPSRPQQQQQQTGLQGGCILSFKPLMIVALFINLLNPTLNKLNPSFCSICSAGTPFDNIPVKQTEAQSRDFTQTVPGTFTRGFEMKTMTPLLRIQISNVNPICFLDS